MRSEGKHLQNCENKQYFLRLFSPGDKYCSRKNSRLHRPTRGQKLYSTGILFSKNHLPIKANSAQSENKKKTKCKPV